jgi:5,10-methylenetetrahydromethanopterin reductase
VKHAQQDFVVPHPLPIYVATRGRQILRAAGEIADGAIVGGLTSTKGLEYCMSELRRGAERVGRELENFEFVSWVYTSISEDSKLAREQVKPLICFLIMTSRASLNEMGIDPVVGAKVLEALEKEGITGPTSPNIKRATELLSDEIVDGCSLAGTPEEITAKIRRMERIGASQVAILPFPLPGRDFNSVMKEFAEYVMPAFR